MKKLLPLVMLMGFTSPAMADITHRMTSSVNLHTGAAYNTAERIGSTYTASGSGVTMDVGGGVGGARGRLGARDGGGGPPRERLGPASRGGPLAIGRHRLVARRRATRLGSRLALRGRRRGGSSSGGGAGGAGRGGPGRRRTGCAGERAARRGPWGMRSGARARGRPQPRAPLGRRGIRLPPRSRLGTGSAPTPVPVGPPAQCRRSRRCGAGPGFRLRGPWVPGRSGRRPRPGGPRLQRLRLAPCGRRLQPLRVGSPRFRRRHAPRPRSEQACPGAGRRRRGPGRRGAGGGDRPRNCRRGD